MSSASPSDANPSITQTTTTPVTPVSNHAVGPNKRPSSRFARRFLAANVLLLFVLALVPQPVQAAASVNLDQCRNGAFTTAPTTCTWGNGNVGSSNGHFYEGQSAAYRAHVTGLTAGAHWVEIGYDMKEGGLHAFDYLTFYDRHNTTNVLPCSGISGCSMTGTFAIPVPNSIVVTSGLQPATSFNALPAGERLMSISGGTITGISYTSQGSQTATASSSILRVNYISTGTSVVLAWGGHISTQTDWGLGQAAAGISGSSYHMRIEGMDTGNVGNTDKSMNANAVIPVPPINPQSGSLTVVKQVVNDNGGPITNVPASFSISVLNASNGHVLGSPAPGSSIGTSYVLAPGTYHITETGPAGYALSFSASCPGGVITIADDDIKTCVLTNNDTAPKLTVVKVVINDNGGSLAPTAVPLFVDGLPVTNGTKNSFNVGSHTVTETAQPGYTQSFSASCPGGIISLALTDDKVCTVTNDDQQSYLNVTKVFTLDNGGSATLADVQLYIDFGEAGQQLVQSGVPAPVLPGLHTVSEIGPSGYLGTFSGFCAADGTVTVPLGATRACTINNDDQQSYLNVSKAFTLDNGGIATLADAHLYIDGTEVPIGIPQAVGPGAHTVSEDPIEGYVGTFSLDCDAQGGVTVPQGATKHCLITNDDQQSYLNISKEFILDNGGSATLDDVTVYIDGVEVPLGIPQAVGPGSHTVTEDAISGYTASFSLDCNALGDVIVAQGSTKECRITNNDQQSYLNVSKEFTLDNGGSATLADAHLYVDGVEVLLLGVPQPVSPGQHTVTEDAISGYVGTFSLDCAEGGLVSVPQGATRHCLITNDDQQSYLNISKEFTLDNGGSATLDDVTVYIDGDEVPLGIPQAVDPGQHLVSEDAIAGYVGSFSLDCDGFGFVTVLQGATKECRITNDDQQSYLNVSKEFTLDNGGIATLEDVTVYIDGVEVPLGVPQAVDPGQHVVSEDAITGYTASFSLDCDAQGSVDVPQGTTKECLITNDDQQSYLNVSKEFMLDNGGIATLDDVTVYIDGVEVPLGIPQAVGPGSHTVSEDAIQGYVGTFSLDCDEAGSVDVPQGTTKECRITNDDQQSYLNVSKEFTLDNGGIATLEDVTVYIDGVEVPLGIPQAVGPGSHTVSEDPIQGYVASFSVDCDADGNVSVLQGTTKHCVLTNDDQQSYLNVSKEFTLDNGGIATLDDATLYIDGTEVPIGVPYPVGPGSHTVSEDPIQGYVGTFSLDCDEAGSVDVPQGTTKECLITNDDQQSYLNISKEFTLDNGGIATLEDVTVYIDGVEVPLGIPQAVGPGQHIVSEDPIQGYVASFSLDCDETGSVDVPQGTTKECRITNDDQQSYLNVSKEFTLDNGGIATLEDVTVYIDGVEVQLGVPQPVGPGSHTVTEDAMQGYVASFSLDCDEAGSVDVPQGTTKECLITNDDQQSYLNVSKKFMLDNGGIATLEDVTVYIDGVEVPIGIPQPVGPGSHIVSEDAIQGYVASFSLDCDAEGDVNVPQGTTKECLITNDDQQSYLNVSKEFTLDNGGIATLEDVTVYIDGVEVPLGVPQPVGPGSHTVSEDAIQGYVASFSLDCDDAGLVDVPQGTTKECLITNDDQQSYLNVSKEFMLDNGGIATLEDVTVFIDGVEVPLGVPQPVGPGGHIVSETPIQGYVASFSLDCDAEGDVNVPQGTTKECLITNDDQQSYLNVSKEFTLDNGGIATLADAHLFIDGVEVAIGVPQPVGPGSHSVSETPIQGYEGSFSLDCDDAGLVDVPQGTTKECLITNDDQQSYLNVSKEFLLDNGGIATLADAHLFIDGVEVPIGIPQPVGPGSHSVSETPIQGYEGSFTLDCDDAGLVDVPQGTTKECLITNDDQQSYLNVSKEFTLDNGGIATLADAHLFIDGVEVAIGVPQPVGPGSHSVSETPIQGYEGSFSLDCDDAGLVDVPQGTTKECLITNDDQQSYLNVSKEFLLDNGGIATLDDVTVYIDGVEVPLGIPQAVGPGQHTVSEDAMQGYVASFSLDCDESGSVDVPQGTTKECLITNDDQQSYLNVSKQFILDNGGIATLADVTVFIDGVEVPLGVPQPVGPGSHTVTETAISGYTTSFGLDCDEAGSVDVPQGTTKQCRVINDDQQSYLNVSKAFVLDHGGQATQSDAHLFIDGVEVTKGVPQPVGPGLHTVSETAMAGYTASFSLDCDSAGLVDVPQGTTKHCRITNDDQPASLRVIKVVINDNGGVASASAFSIHVNGTDVSLADFPAAASPGTLVTLDAGSYAVTEAAFDGYLASYSADCSGTLLPGQNKTCTVTNDDLSMKRMTGGGSIGTSTAKHGFTLHCVKTVEPNRLEVNWGKGQKFHLESLTLAQCTDDPAIKPANPKTDFDTYYGKGTGRYNGVAGATAEWTFKDAGEPGKKDLATIVIKDAGGATVLSVSGLLTSGNHQAHT